MDRTISQREQPHNLARLGFGFFAAPAAWAVQLLLGYVLALPSCQVGSKASMYILSVAAAVVAIAAALTSYAGWKKYSQGGERRITDLEVNVNRSEFLSMAGVIVSLVFLALIVYTGVAAVFLSACPVLTQPLP